MIDTLKDNFDIDIHHYVEVDFKSFQDVVDAIGNVSVYFPAACATTRPGSTRRRPRVLSRSTAARRSRTCGRAHADLGPERPIVDPDTGEHWRLLDVAPTSTASRASRTSSASSRARDREEPERPVPRARHRRQRARGHQGRPGLEPRRRERADPRVQDRRRERPELGAVRDASRPCPTRPTRTSTLVPGPAPTMSINQLRTFGDNTPPPPSVAAVTGEGAGARRHRQEHRRGHARSSSCSTGSSPAATATSQARPRW